MARKSPNSFEFTCPLCGYSSRIDMQFIGRKGPCSNCGKSITVTAPGPVTAAVVGESSGSGGKKTLLVLGIVGGVLLFGALLLGLFVAMLYPAINKARAATQTSNCANKMRQIAAALNAYHDEYGSYPPAYTTDETGARMHSWRVLILPQLGQQSLYDKVNFDEPWDSPTNSYVAQMMPDVYACPAQPAATRLNETSYMVITGPETAFPGEATVSRDDILDNHQHTLLVVEVENSSVGWTQPVDLPSGQISWQINGPPGNSVGSLHAQNEVVVSFVSGQVETLTPSTTPQTLHDLSTIAGNEFVQLPTGR